MPEPDSNKNRNPDVFTATEAAAYMGISRLERLPDHLKPKPLAYGNGLYHRKDLDEAINKARPKPGKGLALRTESTPGKKTTTRSPLNLRA